jgi:predicted nucleotidyltransferase
MVTVTSVENVTAVLERSPGVRLAVLFGSMARGRARDASDLDLGVALMPGEEVPRSWEITLERAAGRPVSITRLETAPPLLRFEISRDGILLLEREPGAWARFKAQAMIDWWDWAPTARMMHRIMGERLREEADRGSA